MQTNQSEESGMFAEGTEYSLQNSIQKPATQLVMLET